MAVEGWKKPLPQRSLLEPDERHEPHGRKEGPYVHNLPAAAESFQSFFRFFEKTEKDPAKDDSLRRFVGGKMLDLKRPAFYNVNS